MRNPTAETRTGIRHVRELASDRRLKALHEAAQRVLGLPELYDRLGRDSEQRPKNAGRNALLQEIVCHLYRLERKIRP